MLDISSIALQKCPVKKNRKGIKALGALFLSRKYLHRGI